MHRSLPVGVFVVVAALALAGDAAAVVVDGRLDPEYGAPLSVQILRTPFDDHNAQINDSIGSELDEAYGFVSDGTLHLFFSGNLRFSWTIEGTTQWLPLDLFLDTGAGGQNTLLSNNPSPSPTYDLSQMAGLRFEDAFGADWWLSVGGDLNSWPRLAAYAGALPAGGGGAGQFLGTTVCASGDPLSGGTNPYGIQVAMIDSNTAGVAGGCGPSSGSGVATGVEWAIPLAAIGNPSGCIMVVAVDVCGNHACILNQVLGPLPPGTCGTLSASSVNFSSLAGDQFFTVCPATTPARPTSWGTLKVLYR